MVRIRIEVWLVTVLCRGCFWGITIFRVLFHMVFALNSLSLYIHMPEQARRDTYWPVKSSMPEFIEEMFRGLLHMNAELICGDLFGNQSSQK
jgi:hypothetical protein